MYIGIIFVIGLLSLFTILILFTLRIIKKNKKNSKEQRNVIKEIQEEFEYFEDKMKGGKNNNGTTNPYIILWEIAKKRRDGEGLTIPSRTEQATIGGQLPQQLIRRQDVPIRTTSSSNENTNSIRINKQNRIRAIFSRRKPRN